MGLVMLKPKVVRKTHPRPILAFINTVRTGLLNCLNARSRGLIQSEVRFL